MSQVEHAVETVTFPLPPPPGLSVEPLVDGGRDALVLSFPVPEARGSAAALTAAERAIVEGLLGGLTNLELALRRGVSKHTVANQIAAVFTKLKVRSRLDLALLVRNQGIV
jgi:DNA-binding NarL/FixJ family response regulator